ncbi:MAG: nucleotide-diphospho-sugar transferase [Bacteroidota bacterium]|nr:nucleotide-diphospho-sugar transferase [Bacteroidota bacterium]
MYPQPILFLIFNRPECTKVVFEQIKNIKPIKLYIAADGPRASVPDDIFNCKEARSIIENVDWNCNVKLLLREQNLGCGKAVSEAISWFFSFEKMGVILEDDTLPNPSFFEFCNTMLIKYESNDKVMHINGTNYGIKSVLESRSTYYFTKYMICWGWATWSKSWEKYNFKIDEVLKYNDKKNELKKLFYSSNEKAFWNNSIEKVRQNKIDTWDIQWAMTIWINAGFCIQPNYNLVSNIGFDSSNATHTKEYDPLMSNLSTELLPTIIHPEQLIIDQKADELLFKKLYLRWLPQRNYLLHYTFLKIKEIFSKTIKKMK